jgi:hypothetical protein
MLNLHDLSKVLAERRKQVFHATLLNQDNHPLATGEAIIEGSPPRGVFWPDHPAHEDIQSSSAVTLCRLDGTSVVVSHFYLCPALTTTVHYHFDVQT